MTIAWGHLGKLELSQYSYSCVDGGKQSISDVDFDLYV